MDTATSAPSSRSIASRGSRTPFEYLARKCFVTMIASGDLHLRTTAPRCSPRRALGWPSRRTKGAAGRETGNEAARAGAARGGLPVRCCRRCARLRAGTHARPRGRPLALGAGRGRRVVRVLPGTVPVARVVDGDTIDVTIWDETRRVRLLLVDTPEVRPTECYGPEASEYVSSLLPEGSEVRLERDVTDTDAFGRLLRYVYLPDGRMLNELLLEGGYAAVFDTRDAE
ncbi:MAG: hypothetical protein F4056_02295, partial [Chloroflexi bacterium]|nr:hypothetical protein [Chloroflexota bacterium]